MQQRTLSQRASIEKYWLDDCRETKPRRRGLRLQELQLDAMKKLNCGNIDFQLVMCSQCDAGHPIMCCGQYEQDSMMERQLKMRPKRARKRKVCLSFDAHQTQANGIRRIDKVDNEKGSNISVESVSKVAQESGRCLAETHSKLTAKTKRRMCQQTKRPSHLRCQMQRWT